MFHLMYLHNNRGNVRALSEDETEVFDLVETLRNDVNLVNANTLVDSIQRPRSPNVFDINAINHAGKTVLSECVAKIRSRNFVRRSEIERIKSDVVNVLISNGASVHVRVPHEYGDMNSILHVACDSFCQLNIVQLLLDNGINVNDLNDFDQTALHYAAGREQFDVMSLLIVRGAKVNARDKENNTPMIFLMKTFAYELYYVTDERRYVIINNCLDLLLRNGGNLNDIGKENISCLFMAINGLGVNRESFVSKLIDEGADVNVGYLKGEEDYVYQVEESDPVTYVVGDTPLHAAANLGDKRIVKLLLTNNADINRCNSLNQTPVDYAIRNGHFEIRDEINYFIRKSIYGYYRYN